MTAHPEVIHMSGKRALGAIAVMILGPLALVAAARWARRATYTTMGHGAKQT